MPDSNTLIQTNISQSQPLPQINLSLELDNPHQTNRKLYNKYSSSQTYYYSNILSQIVRERRTPVNISYQDIYYACDTEEYIKRFYRNSQYPKKMTAFKQFYFYHEDAPRMFIKKIDEIYSKWQDRRRNLVYKKLKAIYNESASEENQSCQKDTDKKSASGITHLLLEISDYNPFSKNYYMRVEAKKNKEKLKKSIKKGNSIRDISVLNHQLSAMLNNMSNLSVISTLKQVESPKMTSVYHSKKLKINQSSEYSTHHSRTNSNILNSTKYNFKKDKVNKLINQFNKKIEIKNQSRDFSNLIPKNSPKFIEQAFVDPFNKKSKSIIKISNINSKRKSQPQLKQRANPSGKKKADLKIDLSKYKNLRNTKVSFFTKSLKRYDSQKKGIVQPSQNRKSVQSLSNPYNVTPIKFQSINSKNSVQLKMVSVDFKNVSSIKNSQKDSQRKQLTGKQFSDSKILKSDEIKFRSHKSQHSLASKLQPLRSVSLSKNIYQSPETIRKVNSQTSRKISIKLQKRSPQLNIY